jgi:hypothetical protein
MCPKCNVHSCAKEKLEAHLKSCENEEKKEKMDKENAEEKNFDHLKRNEPVKEEEGKTSGIKKVLMNNGKKINQMFQSLKRNLFGDGGEVEDAGNQSGGGNEFFA